MNYDTELFIKAMIEEPGVAKRYVGTLQPGWVTPVELVIVADKILSFTEKHGIAPDFPTLRRLFQGEDVSAYNIRYKDTIDRLEKRHYSAPELKLCLEQANAAITSLLIRHSVNDPDFIRSQDSLDSEGSIEYLDGLLKGINKVNSSGSILDKALEDCKRYERVMEEWAPIRYFKMFEPQEIHLLSGTSSTGKSSLALWLGAHWALGKLPFTYQKATDEDMHFERVRAPKSGYMVYFGADLSLNEALGKIKRFQTAQMSEGTTPFPLGDDGDYVSDFGVKNCLYITNSSPFQKDFSRLRLDEEGVDEMISVVKGFGKTVGESATPFIVLDSLATFMPLGASENDNGAMTEAMLHAQRLATETRGCVLLLHHVSQAQHAVSFKELNPLIYGRGGTGTAAKARVILALQRLQGTEGQFMGLKTVSNNFAGGEPWYFRVHDKADFPTAIRYFELVSEEEVLPVEPKETSVDEFVDALKLAYPTGECSTTEAKTVLAGLLGVTHPNDKRVGSEFKTLTPLAIEDGILEKVKGSKQGEKRLRFV